MKFTQAKVRRGLRTNCHVKWSAQKGIGEGSGRLCQTDGTPCCVFDWKRKVTFAATSKRQWSAKQIGLWSTPVLERGLLQGGPGRLYFTVMLCVRLFTEQREMSSFSSLPPSFQPKAQKKKVFVERDCRACCKISWGVSRVKLATFL